MKLYQEELLDHYKYPRNKGSINNPDLHYIAENFSCGDSLFITATMDANKFVNIKFEGSGCVISQAATSLLTELIINKTIDFAQQLTKNNIIELIKIEIGPTRLKCALLGLEAIQNAIQIYLDRKK